jgi:hypothetical protein
MPNWCSNSFSVEGDKETIDRFEDFLNENDGKDWFDFFAPIPVGLVEDDLYEWNISNWGCKWNCDAQDWIRKENKISFWFDSPWGPPTELYYKIEQAGLKVNAEYMEEGMRFVGEFVNGFDETYEYQNIKDLDSIPDHLVENWNLYDQFESWENEEEQ